jgi:hypothetical protein
LEHTGNIWNTVWICVKLQTEHNRFIEVLYCYL